VAYLLAIKWVWFYWPPPTLSWIHPWLSVLVVYIFSSSIFKKYDPLPDSWSVPLQFHYTFKKYHLHPIDLLISPMVLHPLCFASIWHPLDPLHFISIWHPPISLHPLCFAPIWHPPMFFHGFNLVSTWSIALHFNLVSTYLPASIVLGFNLASTYSLCFTSIWHPPISFHPLHFTLISNGTNSFRFTSIWHPPSYLLLGNPCLCIHLFPSLHLVLLDILVDIV